MSTLFTHSNENLYFLLFLHPHKLKYYHNILQNKEGAGLGLSQFLFALSLLLFPTLNVPSRTDFLADFLSMSKFNPPVSTSITP
jgi:hypothetical protein